MAAGMVEPGPFPLPPVVDPASLEVRITGRVQGVGFRYFTLEIARQLRLTGHVANTRDGGVRAYAEGPRESLEQFLRSVQRGPDGARVRDVRTRWGAATGEYSTFTIQPTL
jgi:acylphosphatase